MSTDIARRDAPTNVIRSLADAERLGGIAAASGMFGRANQAECVMKMLYARAMGFDPIAGLNGVDMIDGNPTPNAHFWAAAIEDHPRYDYELVRLDNEACTIRFSRDGQVRGETTWTQADAQRAGLAGKKNWTNYPRAMLFARAMTEGGRMHCPGLFGGVRAYAPEELRPDEPPPAAVNVGTVVDHETGEVIDEPAASPAPAPEPPTSEQVDELSTIFERLYALDASEEWTKRADRWAEAKYDTHELNRAQTQELIAVMRDQLAAREPNGGGEPS